MNSKIRVYVIRAVLIILVQVLVLKRVELSSMDVSMFQILIHPLIILMLPVRIPRISLLLIGFVTGLVVDLFYDSPGVHTGAMVLIAFLRPIVLTYLEPDSGYATDSVPLSSKFGLVWYIQYAGILMLIFMLGYFSLEVFTFVYWSTILMRSVFSFLLSFIIVLVYQILFHPKI